MKTVKILYLFPKLLSLYGEYGNITVLSNHLKSNGYNVTVTEYEEGEIDFDFDFIYIGSGTEDNIKEALKRIEPIKNKLTDYYNDGKIILSTGNGIALFGEEIDGEKALGWLDIKAETKDKRFLSDVLTDNSNPFGFELVGFINTSYNYVSNETSFAKCLLNEAENGIGCGIIKKGFYGVQLIGPFLCKNADAIPFFENLILNEKHEISNDSNLSKAHKSAVNELQKRIGVK